MFDGICQVVVEGVSPQGVVFRNPVRQVTLVRCSRVNDSLGEKIPVASPLQLMLIHVFSVWSKSFLVHPKEEKVMVENLEQNKFYRQIETSD